MDKLVLLSIVALTIVVPAIAARERNPRFAFEKMLVWMLMGIFTYVASVLFVYPRLHG
jgi:hypothetical protein